MIFLSQAAGQHRRFSRYNLLPVESPSVPVPVAYALRRCRRPSHTFIGRKRHFHTKKTAHGSKFSTNSSSASDKSTTGLIVVFTPKMSTKASSTKHRTTARYVFDSGLCSSVDPRAPRQRVRMVSIKTNDAFMPGFKGTECKVFRHTLGGARHEDNAEVTERLSDGAKILQSKKIQEEEVQRHIEYDSALNLKASQKNPRVRE